ncbi:hypothetical protein [Verrucomicrobium spinosum]|uniref:hypothetical protein n=1 Tax=Verrucomicrobium spinosum TaxID=2736 RepID=UPI0009461C81|nr:hypothetical protein [Verrucomicrobium spinosum]
MSVVSSPASLRFATGAPAPGPDTIGAKESLVMTIEGVALQHGLVPVNLLRESCPPEAERLLRKLGRMPYTADPWLPVATLGPLLVMAHFNPKATDLWGVPHALAVRVLISKDQYQKTRQDFASRCQQNPIPQENPLEKLEVPRLSEVGLDVAFEWLLKHYPYEPRTRPGCAAFILLCGRRRPS